jgi:hypothetical protein
MGFFNFEKKKQNKAKRRKYSSYEEKKYIDLIFTTKTHFLRKQN